MNLQVLKASANQKHAFSKFGSGNYETLRPRPEQGIDTRASLVSSEAQGRKVYIDT